MVLRREHKLETCYKVFYTHFYLWEFYIGWVNDLDVHLRKKKQYGYTNLFHTETLTFIKNSNKVSEIS